MYSTYFSMDDKQNGGQYITHHDKPSPLSPSPFPQENVSLRYGVVIRVSHLSVEDKENGGQYVHIAHYDKPSPLPPLFFLPPRECLLTRWSCHQDLSSQHGGQTE